MCNWFSESLSFGSSYWLGLKLVIVVATASTSTVLQFSLFHLPVFCAVNCSGILSATETSQRSKRPAL